MTALHGSCVCVHGSVRKSRDTHREKSESQDGDVCVHTYTRFNRTNTTHTTLVRVLKCVYLLLLCCHCVHRVCTLCPGVNHG